MFLLVLLASLSFAQGSDVHTSCQKSCCSSFQGTWDGYQCTGVSNQVSYDSCVPSCESTANSVKGCCGGAFVLVLVPGMVFLQRFIPDKGRA
jgi:hypothetical protein